VESKNVDEDLPTIRHGVIDYIPRWYLRLKLTEIFARKSSFRPRISAKLISKSTKLLKDLKVRARGLTLDHITHDYLYNLFNAQFIATDNVGNHFITEREARIWVEFVRNLVSQIIVHGLGPDGFNPESYSTPLGAKVNRLVPLYSLAKRHVPIPIATLHSLLHRSGFQQYGLPSNRVFLSNRQVQLSWFLQVFDFRRIGYYNPTIEKLDLDQKRQILLLICRFDCKFYTDSVSISYQFTRPSPLVDQESLPLRPQDIDLLPGTTFRYVDPGRSSAITSIDNHSSNPVNPPVFRSFSTKEFYHTAGYNDTSIKRQEAKIVNQESWSAINHGDFGIIKLESSLPRTRTMNSDVFANYIEAFIPILDRLHLFYSKRFNR